MATTVYNQEDIVLQDGKEVTLRPLPIGRLRRFMDAWNRFADVKTDDEGFDVFLNCAGIALESEFKGQFDSLKATKDQMAEGQYLSDEYKEYLEDTLDLDTIYKILEVTGGIKLNDPNLAEAAAAALAAREEDGTN